MGARVVIDADRCVGSGQCVAVSPRLFAQDERGIGVVRGGGDAGLSASDLREIVWACPGSAISAHVTDAADES